MAALAVVALYGLLLCGVIGAQDAARKLRRREWFRSFMAGLVGLAARWER